LGEKRREEKRERLVCQSTKHSVSRDVLGTVCSVSRNIPVRNIQSVVKKEEISQYKIFQYEIFSQERYSRSKNLVSKYIPVRGEENENKKVPHLPA
jgi:hypothetical protein